MVFGIKCNGVVVYGYNFVGYFVYFYMIVKIDFVFVVEGG